MSNEGAKYDLEERLIRFSLLVLEIVEAIPGTRVGNHIGGQLIAECKELVSIFARSIETAKKIKYLEKLRH